MSKKIILSREDKELIVSMYNNGCRLSDIENRIGHSDKYIYETLDEYGIERNRKSKPLSQDQINKIIKYHKDGLSYGDIADKLNNYVSSTKIYKVLKENGETNSFDEDKINSIIKAQLTLQTRKYYFDEHIFDIIDTPDKAYCIGLFMADGCNSSDLGSFKLELQDTDKSLLEKISIMFQSDHPLVYRDSSKTKNMKHDTFSFVLYSKYFCNKLNDLGITPRKSLTLQFPYWMRENLIPYMLKGYIDGDGWVQKYNIGFMSTKNFCIGAQEYLDSIGIESKILDMKGEYKDETKVLFINNRNNLIPFSEIMFSHGNLFMDRKYQKYIEYGFIRGINNSLSA